MSGVGQENAGGFVCRGLCPYTPFYTVYSGFHLQQASLTDIDFPILNQFLMPLFHTDHESLQIDKF